MFSSRFILFPIFKKKIGAKKIPGGGGVEIFFFIKTILISRFMLFSTLKKKY